jgi:hypothetical protein
MAGWQTAGLASRAAVGVTSIERVVTSGHGIGSLITHACLHHPPHSPQEYADMSNPSAFLKAVNVSHGDMIFMLYRCGRGQGDLGAGGMTACNEAGLREPPSVVHWYG